MSSHSVAEAKNGLPGLIDRALDGEEVLITRHGRVVEIGPALPKGVPPADRRAGFDRLRARREARPSIDVDSNDMLRALADEQRW
ncbi:type II toxin-antitoxin system Phd/YefM family antitoxin [uncultured Sphingomonas sp.]|uniref:type II toxin-antitoxin system Phd/YefM family antitoxin n=1 Tax=uncultured Sphingomonas sp. TaxID=158754 RepID=UPI0035CA437A